MGQPVSVRLDDEALSTLESAARERGIGLSTYLRELAEARRVRRERIRRQSSAVATYVASSTEARAFYQNWS